MEDAINTDEIKRKVSTFINYCDYIKEDFEEDLKEELLDFVMDLIEDYEVENVALKRRLNEM